MKQLLLTITIMGSIGIVVPLGLKVNPPMLVQSVLIPLSLYESSLVQTRLVRGNIKKGCYDEFHEDERAEYESKLKDR